MKILKYSNEEQINQEQLYIYSVNESQSEDCFPGIIKQSPCPINQPS